MDGDAVWFLSPVDPANGQVLRTESGRPHWQRNILYYCTVPALHQELYGFECTGGTDAQGYEVYCPHKVLVRKVIDNPPATGSAETDPMEKLLTPAEVARYLTRPQRFDLPSGEPGVEEATIVANSLVSFRVALSPSPQAPGEVAIQLSAAGVEMARGNINVGSQSLDDFLRVLSFSVFPPTGPAP
jgi:hypothetical protein